MADLFVRHITNSNKTVKFNVTLRSFVDVSTEGETIWTLEVGTLEPDKHGNSIPPSRAHILESDISNLDDVIEKCVNKIAKEINWTPYPIDKYPPEFHDITPIPNSTNVSIFTSVHMRLIDTYPTTGIDLSDMKVTINNGVEDFDITAEVSVEGDPTDYFLLWKPKTRVLSTYM